MSPLELRRCGPQGLVVSALGLGAAALGGGAPTDAALDETGARTLEVAFELGLRHVDTSPAYGQSERRLGIALRRNGLPGMSVSTKVGTHPERKLSYSAEDVRWSLGRSLQVLGVDSVDVAFIHDPPEIERALAPGHGFDALRQLQGEGLCRNVGLGVHAHAFHRTAIARGSVDVILTYGDLNIVRRSGAELMEFAREHGVGVFLGSPMMHGFLASGRRPVDVFAERPGLLSWYTEDDVHTAQEWFDWCREREVSMRHLNMRHVFSTGLADCVLTGARNESELRENLHEATTSIPAHVWREALDRIAELDETRGR